jgi:hypothetical protein
MPDDASINHEDELGSPHCSWQTRPTLGKDVDVATIVDDITRLHLQLSAPISIDHELEDDLRWPRTEQNVPAELHESLSLSVQTQLGQALLRVVKSQQVLNKVLDLRDGEARTILDAAQSVCTSMHHHHDQTLTFP